MSIFPLCLRPWTSFELDDGKDCWGYVQPCCWSLRHVGNIETQSIEEIWNAPGYVNFRKHLLGGDYDHYCSPDCPNMISPTTDFRLYLASLLKNPIPNHLLNLFEIIRGATVLRSTPLHFKISPSLSCNLRCIMCFQDHDSGVCLSDQVIKDIFSLLDRIQLLRLQGGEIFSSKSGLNFLERLTAVKHQPKISIITNGTFPIHYGWELLNHLNMHQIIVSIDAANRNTYHKIRVGGDWDIVINNIKQLCALSKTHKRSFKVYLSYTLMRINYHELYSHLALARSLGTDVVINPFTPSHNTDYLDVMNKPEICNEVLSCLLDAMTYSSEKNMPMAQTSLRMMVSLMTKIDTDKTVVVG